MLPIADNLLDLHIEKLSMKTKTNKKKDFVDELESMLPEKRVRRARIEAEKEIFNIKLSELRKTMGVRQKELDNFSQSSISKIEKRKDMKLSTLIEYLDNIGMNLEIKVYPKKKRKKEKNEMVLLKT